MILKRVGDHLVFTAGKHAGKKVQEVEDKDYLAWVYEKAVLDLSDEDFYKFEDTLIEMRVRPFENG